MTFAFHQPSETSPQPLGDDQEWPVTAISQLPQSLWVRPFRPHGLIYAQLASALPHLVPSHQEHTFLAPDLLQALGLLNTSTGEDRGEEGTGYLGIFHPSCYQAPCPTHCQPQKMAFRHMGWPSDP